MAVAATGAVRGARVFQPRMVPLIIARARRGKMRFIEVFIEGLGMGCPRSITAAALLAASALAEENPLRLLERWPRLPFAQRIRHLLDDSDLKSLLHDFQLLDVDDDGVLDIADLRVALEGTTVAAIRWRVRHSTGNLV